MKQRFGLKGDLNELSINVSGEGKNKANTIIPNLRKIFQRCSYNT